MLDKIKRKARWALDNFYDVKCGLHSGFPPCCIAWFLLAWKNGIFKDPILADAYFNFKDEVYSDHINKDGYSGYITCPLCIYKRNFVEVKTCNCLPGKIKLFSYLK